MFSAGELDHALVVGDCSKALSLSGLRIGWIIDRDRRRHRRYLDLRAYFTLSGSPLAEELATLALEHREQILERVRALAQDNLLLLDELFAEHREILRWIRPQGGLTAFPWLAGGESSRRFCEALAEEGVLLAPGDCFARPEHFRIGFGAVEAPRFREAVEILRRFLAAW